MITLQVNGADRAVEVSAEVPLVWVLRDTLGLTGTKYGCGAGLCGACTVFVNGEPQRSCSVSVGAVVGLEVTTIEGARSAVVDAVLTAWTEHGVAQCGWCQPGMVMAAVALLTRTGAPSDSDIDAAFAGHLCRCGSYQRIRDAVQAAAAVLRGL